MFRTESSAPGIRAGGVDWSERWRAMVEAREAAAPAPSPREGSRWDARAERFARLTRSLDAVADPFVRTLREALRPADTLLDVGAGAGRYCLPLAEAVARVTAVEPSAGMRARLAAEAAARGLHNVDIVASDWEAAAVEPHDVAFVANVLYFVPDAVPFLWKLDHSARRACFILHRVEERTAPLVPLWREIWGQEQPPQPAFLELYNLLFSIGIRPNARLVPRTFTARYDNLDQAVDEARENLAIAPGDHTHDARIRAFLAEVLVEHDGRLGFPHDAQLAIISWEKP
jgi:SAM-dependent methyltransferase